MIHAIIFSKQNGVLDFYQSTPQFPREYLPQIRQVCDRVGAGYVSAQQEYALRYAPLRDYGMLQVMIRNQGNEIDERRVHWNVVTYLLEESDTFRFFLLPFRTAQRNAVALTSALLRAPRGLPLPADLGLRLLAQSNTPGTEENGNIPVQVLLRAAFYGKGTLKNDRLFIQTPGDSALELEHMLQALPPFLRRDISFHTCVYSPEDTRGVSICCCAPPLLERLESSGFNGCEAGNIFFHYSGDSGRKNRSDSRLAEEMCALLQLRDRVVRFDILQFAIRDWNTYLELSKVRERKSALREALSILKDENLEQALEIARELKLEPLTQRELKQFLSAIRGKPGSKRRLKVLRGPLFRPEHLAAAICAAAMLTVIALTCSMAGEPNFWKAVIMWILAFAAGFKLRDILSF